MQTTSSAIPISSPPPQSFSTAFIALLLTLHSACPGMQRKHQSMSSEDSDACGQVVGCIKNPATFFSCGGLHETKPNHSCALCPVDNWVSRFKPKYAMHYGKQTHVPAPILPCQHTHKPHRLLTAWDSFYQFSVIKPYNTAFSITPAVVPCP